MRRSSAELPPTPHRPPKRHQHKATARRRQHAATIVLRTRTSEAPHLGATSSLAATDDVVRRLFRDDDIVRVALAQPGAGDAHEARRCLASPARPPRPRSPSPGAARRPVGTTMSSAGPCTARGPRCPRRSAVTLIDAVLEVAIFAVAALLHGANRAHAAIVLEALALEMISSPGLSSTPAEQTAEHHRIGARRDRLGDIARNTGCRRRRSTGTPSARRRARAFVDGGDLRHANTGHDARRADGVMHDRVVGDEAVRRAIDLNVIDRAPRLPDRVWPSLLTTWKSSNCRFSCVTFRRER